MQGERGIYLEQPQAVAAQTKKIVFSPKATLEDLLALSIALF